jgi:hypothetical protein
MDARCRVRAAAPLIGLLALLAGCTTSTSSGNGSSGTTTGVSSPPAGTTTSAPISSSSAPAVSIARGTATLTLTKDITDNLNAAPTTCSKTGAGEVLYVVTARTYHITITQPPSGTTDELARVSLQTTSHIGYATDTPTPTVTAKPDGSGATLDATLYGPGIPPHNDLEIKISGTVTCTPH